MSLARTDEQTMLLDSLRRYLSEANEFEHRRQRLSAEMPDRLALWPGLADLGMLGVAFDEAAGGFGGEPRSVAVLMGEIGRSLAVEPVLACTVTAGRVLRHSRDGEAIERLIAGEEITVLAHDAGSDPYGRPRVSATAVEGGYGLHGQLRGIRHADVAQVFLVPALLDERCIIVKVPRQALSIVPYRLMDAAAAADLTLDGVVIKQDAVIAFDGGAEAALHDALDWELFGLAAETLGLIEVANLATFEYLATRKQFGTAIGNFQALQHRAADMKTAEQELHALINLLCEAMNEAPTAGRSALLAAAKAVADEAGRRVAHAAIQLHGGMGVSDELSIAHLARRLAAIRQQSGSADTHRLRFGSGQDLSALLALQESPDARTWRQQVADFTRQHLPAHIRRKTQQGLKIDKADYVGWQNVLAAHDLFAGSWPTDKGGQGWSLVKQLVFAQESAVQGAPMISPYGVKMVGPVLQAFGTPEQQARHLPGILDNSVWWCQGYSEPGAGSDLASLKTFAERDGDHYVVNGAKLWTTEAHWADWMHCLVRTDRSVKAQQGISFLLIDMATPGISIKPIVTIDGLHHTNATFFDNVRVPVSHCVGGEGKGWSIAKFLLGNERISIADTGPKLRLLHDVRGLLDAACSSDHFSSDQRALLQRRFADLAIQLLTLCAMERQFVEAWDAGAPFGAEASMLKIRGSEILQDLAEFALEVLGPMGSAYDPADLHREDSAPATAVQQAGAMVYEYLYARCWSIFGGTNEIQRNLIARQILAI